MDNKPNYKKQVRDLKLCLSKEISRVEQLEACLRVSSEQTSRLQVKLQGTKEELGKCKKELMIVKERCTRLLGFAGQLSSTLSSTFTEYSGN